jgi:hypothetical protein
VIEIAGIRGAVDGVLRGADAADRPGLRRWAADEALGCKLLDRDLVGARDEQGSLEAPAAVRHQLLRDVGAGVDDSHARAGQNAALIAHGSRNRSARLLRGRVAGNQNPRPARKRS